MGRILGRARNRLRIGQRSGGFAGVCNVCDPVGPFLHLAVERQRIAGHERARCVLRIDLPGALFRVGLRQQALTGNAHERRVGVVGVAIRVGELERLDHGVEIFGTVLLHRPQIEILQDVERLEQHRSLAVERMLVDFVTPIGRHAWLLDAGEELRKIGELERRLVLLEKADHLRSDVALVEAVTRGHDAGAAAFALVGALRLDHARERARQGRKLYRLAGAVSGAVRLEPIAAVVRPILHEFGIAPDRRHRTGPQRKALLRIFDRARRHRLEAHGAPLVEHRQGGVKRARHHRGIEPLAVEILVPRGAHPCPTTAVTLPVLRG